jgi:hypothetical protein
MAAIREPMAANQYHLPLTERPQKMPAKNAHTNTKIILTIIVTYLCSIFANRRISTRELALTSTILGAI